MVESERKLLLGFLGKYASDDVLIQAANRVSNNIEDLKALKTFIASYVPNVTPTPQPLDTESFVSDSKPFDSSEPLKQEDLGPAAKKLGSNGQAIESFLRKHGAASSTVGVIGQNCKLPASKVKPMIALLIERGKVERVGGDRYRIAPSQV